MVNCDCWDFKFDEARMASCFSGFSPTTTDFIILMLIRNFWTW